MAIEELCTMGEQGTKNDKFIIIAIDPRTKVRNVTLDQIKSWFNDVEIIAPEEERMLRPRRKSLNGSGAVVIKRPIFYQYVAVRWNNGDFSNIWRLKGVFGVWSIMIQNGLPAFVSRGRLAGMLQEQQYISWEGMFVEVMSGPLKGRFGKYVNGRIEIEIFGKNALASISVYNLKLAKQT